MAHSGYPPPLPPPSPSSPYYQQQQGPPPPTQNNPYYPPHTNYQPAPYPVPHWKQRYDASPPHYQQPLQHMHHMQYPQHPPPPVHMPPNLGQRTQPPPVYYDPNERCEKRIARMWLSGDSTGTKLACLIPKGIWIFCAAIFRALMAFLWSFAGIIFLVVLLGISIAIGWLEWTRPQAIQTSMQGRGEVFQMFASLIAAALVISCIVRFLTGGTLGCVLKVFDCFTCCCRGCGCGGCLDAFKDTLCGDCIKPKQQIPVMDPSKFVYVYNNQMMPPPSPHHVYYG